MSKETNNQCHHDDCTCAASSTNKFCGPECEEQVSGKDPVAEGPQQMLSGQTYDKPECPCGHLDCEQAEPEPQL